MSAFAIQLIPSSGWRCQAACRGESTETFFLPTGQRGVSKRQREAAAKAVCAVCPVSRQCLDWALALALPEPFGVWGGTTPEERDVIRNGPRTRKPAMSRCTLEPGRQLPVAS